MRLKIEELTSQSRILFVATQKTPLLEALQKKLRVYSTDIFHSSRFPERISHFDYVFIFDNITAVNRLFKSEKKPPSLVILYNRTALLTRYAQSIKKQGLTAIKIVNIDEKSTDPDYVDKILWFLFSNSPEYTLNLQKHLPAAKKNLISPAVIKFPVTKQKLLFVSFMLFLFLEFFFLIPMFTGFFLLYQGLSALKQSNIAKAEDYMTKAEPLVKLTNLSYTLARPAISFFYLALFPDDLVRIENTALTFIKTGIATAKNGQKIVALILDADKSEEKQGEIRFRLQTFLQQADTLQQSADTIAAKVKPLKLKPMAELGRQLVQVKESIEQIKKIVAHADTLIGGESEKKYLLLFQNNMELRPGGGFIGSYGIITFSNYTLKNLTVEDVYEADGQLTTHIEPPPAIRKYLNQPNWFLRDSNFSPDFEKNFKNAEFFLYKELGLTGLNGAIGLTTTAISYILESFENIYLPDYKETITAENFYIKTQIESQHNFFPGSKQKRNFLSSLLKVLLGKLKTIPFTKVSLSLKKALDEKQIVIYVKDEAVQKDINQLGFSGRLVIPQCTPEWAVSVADADQCITDSIFAVDANLGVNKANFFVRRSMTLKTTINSRGKIEHVFEELFHNDSPANVFPGGVYKNYLQVYLPQDVSIQAVTFNNQPVAEYEERIEEPFKIAALLVSIPPKSSGELVIRYTREAAIEKDRIIYQLIVQKQIGALNSDLSLEFSVPKTLSASPQNFQAVAKAGRFSYNTTLSNDRIFFIELVKQQK